jgi:hypothetical protein
VPRTIRARVLLGSVVTILVALAVIAAAVPGIATQHEIDVLARGWRPKLPSRVTCRAISSCVAHNLERMGDRVQNACERTVYEVTGVMREFSSHVPRQADADG